MAKKISVLVVEPGTSPRLMQTEDTMKAFEKIVGGPVEIGYMPSLRVMLFYNGEENSRGPDEWGRTPLQSVSGTYLLCGCGNNRHTSLSPSQEVVFRRWFAQKTHSR